MKSIIFVIVEKDDNVTKYIPTVRKNTFLGLSDIKSKIENREPVLEWELFKDEEQDEKAESLITSLTDLGAELKFYDGVLNPNKEVSSEYLVNRINRFKEIQKQNQELDDLMYGDDD